MTRLPLPALAALAALLASPIATAKCYKVLAAKAVIFECRSSPASFPGAIRDQLGFRFQGATVAPDEDEKCASKAPACEDAKAAEAAAEQHRTTVRRHDGNVADAQNACADKRNSASECRYASTGSSPAVPPAPSAVSSSGYISRPTRYIRYREIPATPQ